MHTTAAVLALWLAQGGVVPAQRPGNPQISVVPSRPSVQKGGVFEIRMLISASEPLTGIAIAPLPPHGFYLEPIPSPHVDVADSGRTVRLGQLAGQSSLTVTFRVWPPRMFAGSRVPGDAGPMSTEEPKVFVFNVFYRLGRDSLVPEMSQTVSTTVAYTTNLGIYLFSGLIGALLGILIKTGTRSRAEIQQAARASAGVRRAISGARALVLANPAGVITSLIIAFGALLAMAKDGIPVAGWHQAVALGIGLAVLADDQLLSKFSGAP